MAKFIVPRIFWEDHNVERCCSPDAVVLKTTSRTVHVELNNDDLEDLNSDAEHYGFGGLDFAGEREAYRSLINSARATVRALKRQNHR